MTISEKQKELDKCLIPLGLKPVEYPINNHWRLNLNGNGTLISVYFRKYAWLDKTKEYVFYRYENEKQPFETDNIEELMEYIKEFLNKNQK